VVRRRRRITATAPPTTVSGANAAKVKTESPIFPRMDSPNGFTTFGYPESSNVPG